MAVTGPPPPHVVGIDPSLTATGIASSRGWTQTVGRKEVTKLRLADRGAALRGLAQAIVEHAHDADLVVVEGPAFSRTSGGAHERAGLWWLVQRGLAHLDVTVVEVKPNLRALYATGKGAAKKTQVVEQVTRRWPQYETGGNDNVADAIVLMAMGRDALGYPLSSMPAVNRAALDKVSWSDVLAAA